MSQSSDHSDCPLSKEKLAELEKDYFVSWNGGFLSLGAKKIYITTRKPEDSPQINIIKDFTEGIQLSYKEKYIIRKVSNEESGQDSSAELP